MQAFRIRVHRIIDNHELVSLIGVDANTGEPISIDVKHGAAVSSMSPMSGREPAERVEYQAHGLVLRLDIVPEHERNGAELVECDASDRTKPRSIREVEQ